MGEQPPIAPPIQEITLSEPIFYPGIAKNTLLFHGTRSQEKLQQILKQGLKPPDEAISRDTLARRISFCDAERYIGLGDGAIIAFKPRKEEVSPNNPHFARTQQIALGINHLPPERAIFYIPGRSRLPRTLFDSMKQAVTDYYMHGFNKEPLVNSLQDMVVIAERQLTQEAVFVSTKPVDTHQVAHELVWNELCGRLTHDYDDVEYNTTLISKLREKGEISSTGQLVQLIHEDNDFNTFDPTIYLNLVKLLSTVDTINGLGFEDIPYQLNENVVATRNWISILPESVQEAQPVSPRNTLRRLLNRFKR